MLALAPGAAASSEAQLPLKTVVRVPLRGPVARFDYMSLDPSTNLLWIAHLGSGELLSFDVEHRVIHKTAAVPGVHGVIAVPQLRRVFASATEVKRVFMLDSSLAHVLRSAPGGVYPDGLAWESHERRVFVSDESGGALIVIDAHGRRIGTIPLGGEAGNVQYDPVSRRVLVDVQTKNEVAVVDPRANRVVRRIPLTGCVHDHGLLVDSVRRLAFVACDGNAALLTLDLVSKKVTGSATVGRDPDVLAFDSSLRRLYVAAESGVVAVFAERGRGLAKLGQAFLAPAAHTVAVDPATHLVYFPLERGPSGGPELLIMRPR